MKTENKNKWTTFVKPFYDEPIDLEMFGADVRIKKSKIYEDEKVRVIHIEEPTFQNEFNNYLELLIKNGAMLMHFPIGGYTNMAFAIESVKNVIDALSLSSNDKQEKKPLSEISDEDAIAVYDLTQRRLQGRDKVDYLIERRERAIQVTYLNDKNVHLIIHIDEFNIELWDDENEPKLLSVYKPFTAFQYLQFKGYNVPVYYPEKKGESNE